MADDDHRLREALAAAEQAGRSRDDILAVVAHEIRGPLHAISLAVEALRDEVGEGGLRYLASIERASQRAERLIADLLEAHRIETGAIELEPAPIDAAAIIRQVVAEHEAQASDARCPLTMMVPPEPTIVMADRERVRQVLGNLMSNALKHARGTPVTVELSRQGADAVFVVRVAGPGIADALLPHVFDRYGAGRVRSGGAGLGLPIANGIVSAHGGRMTAWNCAHAAGEATGTAVSFTLPLAR